MRRNRPATALALAALLLGPLAACDTAVPPTPTAPTATGPLKTIAPVIHEGGPPDIGTKWNGNPKPPLAPAEAVGWGETFYEVEWCALRDRPAAQRLAPVERILGMSQAMGYRLMLKIRVGNCQGGAEQLDPAEGTRKRPRTFPDDPAAYQQFVSNLVTRYRDRGVKIWAIENEVDASNFWSGTPDEYVELVALASQAIKAADPEASILDAGISSTGYGIELAGELLDAGQDQQALDLYTAWFARRHGGGSARFPAVESIGALKTLMADGRAQRVRAMVAANWRAVNAGGVTAYQLHFYENPDLLATLLTYVRSHLTVEIPIQGWEIGQAWPGPGYTTAAHGAETARLIGMLLRERVSPVVYLPLAFTPGGATKVEIFRGLVTPEGVDLPAGQVFDRYAAALRGSRELHGVTFAGGSGEVILGASESLAVVWPDSGTTLAVAGPGAIPAGAPETTVPAGTATADPVLVPLAQTDLDAVLSALTTLVTSPVTRSG